ncbi:hypothetical protein CFIMG_008088RA00001 [Ceratocystis fimbriata CBS 114723]|uniref:Uncharacterized protein n=1 Tax=Ceratocystis fimbriata CBS 114723 TaxID=1035309 RepID=A0A2C5X759_9PEZI|nr:hypothetical protein CFIMG_008088RA00001 [Ceratocystis fimbriata CBS 114723]
MKGIESGRRLPVVFVPLENLVIFVAVASYCFRRQPLLSSGWFRYSRTPGADGVVLTGLEPPTRGGLALANCSSIPLRVWPRLARALKGLSEFPAVPHHPPNGGIRL